MKAYLMSREELSIAASLCGIRECIAMEGAGRADSPEEDGGERIWIEALFSMVRKDWAEQKDEKILLNTELRELLEVIKHAPSVLLCRFRGEETPDICIYPGRQAVWLQPAPAGTEQWILSGMDIRETGEELLDYVPGLPPEEEAAQRGKDVSEQETEDQPEEDGNKEYEAYAEDELSEEPLAFRNGLPDGITVLIEAVDAGSLRCRERLLLRETERGKFLVTAGTKCRAERFYPELFVTRVNSMLEGGTI